jgi:hypothetical protein
MANAANANKSGKLSGKGSKVSISAVLKGWMSETTYISLLFWFLQQLCT